MLGFERGSSKNSTASSATFPECKQQLYVSYVLVLVFRMSGRPLQKKCCQQETENIYSRQMPHKVLNVEP